MKVLLDTHALLWWFFDDPKLSAIARDTIKTPENTILVSSASAWEITTKFRLGKLPEAADAVHNLVNLIRKARMEPLPITIEHAQLAGSLNSSHRDPFDRMLAAQCQIEHLPLVTLDPVFRDLGVDAIW